MLLYSLLLYLTKKDQIGYIDNTIIIVAVGNLMSVHYTNIYIYIYIYIYVCVCVCNVYFCVYVRTCAHMHTWMHTHTHSHTYIILGFILVCVEELTVSKVSI